MYPPWSKNRCLEYHYTKLGRQTYFGQWTWHISWQMYPPPIICQLIWMAKFQMFTIRAHLGRSPGWWTPQMHHGIYLMVCIWQPFWILQEKVGSSLYFWIIRVVNSQLALYSHVRCNPPWHPKHPWNTPKTPPHDNYKFQLWELIFARCNM